MEKIVHTANECTIELLSAGELLDFQIGKIFTQLILVVSKMPFCF